MKSTQFFATMACVVVTGLVTASCGLLGSNQASGHEFWLVNRVQFLDARNLQARGKVYPWLIKSEMGKEGHVLLSNACGFATIAYEGIAIEIWKSAQSATDYGSAEFEALLGERCDLRPYIIGSDEPALLSVRNWKGKAYIMDLVPVYVSSAGLHFISDREFIADHSLSEKITIIPLEKDDSACFDVSLYSPKKLRVLSDQNYISLLDEDIACYGRGVMLEDL